MLIVSKKSLHKSVETGKFFCPSCESRRAFGKFRVYDTYNLFGLVLKRGPQTGEYIACATCHNRFRSEVLKEHINSEASSFLLRYNEYFERIAKGLIQICPVDDDTANQVRQYLSLISGELDVLDHAPGSYSSDPALEIQQIVANLAPELNDEARDIFFQLINELASIIDADKRLLAPTLKAIKSEIEKPSVL